VWDAAGCEGTRYRQGNGSLLRDRTEACKQAPTFRVRMAVSTPRCARCVCMYVYLLQVLKMRLRDEVHGAGVRIDCMVVQVVGSMLFV
jgi:hypothetical protein